MVAEAALSPWIALGVASVALLVLLCIGDLVELGPNLLGCLFRWKENVNLYNNMRMRRSRNRIFLALVPAFIIILSTFDVCPFHLGEGAGAQFLQTLILSGGYFLVRLACKYMFCGRQVRSNDFRCSSLTSYSYAIIGILVTFAVAGILGITDADSETSVAVIKWTFIVIYTLFLTREYQVFASFRGYLSAFLYLCALEILPTGLLVASYYVF